jgi:malonate decarboxylase epsilon subunit
MPSMLHSLPNHPVVTETLEEASDTLRENVLLWDSADSLQSTISVQVCLLTAGVAAARALIYDHAIPQFVAGHSVGAFGAAVTAGVLTFSDALKLVKLRGELMESSTPEGYGMGVVVGLTEKQLLAIVSAVHSETSPVYVTNRNSPSQLTVSGSNDAIEKTLRLAKDAGAIKAEPLQVRVPSHCPLFTHISDRLAKELNAISTCEPKLPYMSNRSARRLTKSKDIIEDLAFSISHPVQWHAATSVLYELGVRLFVEMPPGQVLTDLARQAFSDARSVSVSVNGLQTAKVLVTLATV